MARRGGCKKFSTENLTIFAGFGGTLNHFLLAL
jgi:hypothetical protein